MDKVFFEQLELPQPKYNLDVGSGSHGKQTGTMMIGIEHILQKEQPDVVLVQGDTNTVLAGALATAHRQENVDNKTRFSGIIKGLQAVEEAFGIPVVYPIHPRAKKMLTQFGIDTSGLRLLEPLDYLAFLVL